MGEDRENLKEWRRELGASPSLCKRRVTTIEIFAHTHRKIRHWRAAYVRRGKICIVTAFSNLNSSHSIRKTSLPTAVSMDVKAKIEAFNALKNKATKRAYLEKINENITSFKNRIKVSGSVAVITANYRAYLERVAATSGETHTVLYPANQKKFSLTHPRMWLPHPVLLVRGPDAPPPTLPHCKTARMTTRTTTSTRTTGTTKTKNRWSWKTRASLRARR